MSAKVDATKNGERLPAEVKPWQPPSLSVPSNNTATQPAPQSAKPAGAPSENKQNVKTIPSGPVAEVIDFAGNGGISKATPPDPKTVVSVGSINNPTSTGNGSGARYGTGSGGGSSAAAGTAPAATAPVAIDSSEQPTNPYAQPIDDYRTGAQSIIDQLRDATDKPLGEYRTEAQGIIDQLNNATKAPIDDYRAEAQGIIDQLKAATDKPMDDYATGTQGTIDSAKAQLADALRNLQAALPNGEAGRAGRVNTVEEENLLRQIVDAQTRQSEGRIDDAVRQGVDQLARAEEDAREQFQTQRNQVAAQEAQALDNQALYAEARGDRGGIGQAQYASIQNAAATNQLTVNKEQTKLATDTARQIADLRAQGEFKKADELLSITQAYLSELMQLKQWADATNVSIDEFNIGVEQWEQEYNAKIQQLLAGEQMDAAKYITGLDLNRQSDLLQGALSSAQQQANLGMGVADKVAAMNTAAAEREADLSMGVADRAFNTALQMAQQQANLGMDVEDTALKLRMQEIDAMDTKMANAAQQMIAAGVTPTDAQLQATGWTRSQYDAYRAAVEKANAAASSGGGGKSKTSLYSLTQDLISGNVKSGVIAEFLANQRASNKYEDADWKQSMKLLGDAAKRGYKGAADYDYTG